MYSYVEHVHLKMTYLCVLLIFSLCLKVNSQSKPCTHANQCNYDTCGQSVYYNSMAAVYGCNCVNYYQKTQYIITGPTSSSGTFSMSLGGTCSHCFKGQDGSYSWCPCPSSCPAGQYVLNCDCTTCSTGSYCTGSAQKTNCFAGTYNSNTGSSALQACLPCSVGTYSNSSGASICIECTPGTFGTIQGGTSFQSACNNCPVNSYCTGGSHMAPCDSICSIFGTYESIQCTSSTNRVCSPCINLVPNSVYIGVGTNSSNCPWICIQGYYLSNGLCFPCPVNNWCSNNNLNICPVNSSSPQFSVFQNQCFCNPGYFGNASLTGTSPCQICPVNSYCPGGNNNLSFRCPMNSSSLQGSSRILDCICVPGYYINEGQCQMCLPGNICANSLMTPCPPGSTSPYGSLNISNCVCKPGFYSSNNSNCIQCPNNYYCTNGINIQKCTLNAISPVQSINEIACYCDKGYQGVANVPCIPCANNTWCLNGLVNVCPANSTSPSFSSSLLDCTCPPGFQGSNGGVCVPCVPGTFKNSYGSSTCAPCPQNSTCIEGASNPIPCPRGDFFCDGFVVSQCQICQPGFYESIACSSTMNRNCSPCFNLIPNATYIGVGTQSTDCAWICNSGYYLRGGTCLLCPSGAYCLMCPSNGTCQIDLTQPISCPTNSYSLEGSFFINNCTANAGYFGPSGGPFVPVGSTDKTYCTANFGFFGPAGGNMTQCSANHYCPAGSTAPIPCPNNFISLPGSSTLSDCTVFDCPPGLYLLQTSCVLCPSNNYCPLSSKQPTPCKTCDHVFLSKCDGTGLINDTTTCACNPGFYLSDPNSNNSQCSACPLYTTSAANNTDTTVLSCTCLAGYTCKYTKRIQGLIKLNMTLSDFNSNAQSALIQAIAQAAGVDVSQVSIVSISSGSSNRRLLGTLAEENTLTVIVRINDSQNAHIRKMSKFSVVAHENPSASSSSESTEKEEQGESSSWQLLRAFSHHAHASEQKMITHHFDILSEVWTPSHSIQVSKL
jgi:hypothetical protein